MIGARNIRRWVGCSGIVIPVVASAFWVGSATPARLAPQQAAADARSDIYTIDLTTHRVRKITNAEGGAYYDSPTWSPRGDRLAFMGSICDDCPELDSRLYVTPLRAPAPKRIQVPVSPATRPSWRPGSASLAFIGGTETAVYTVGVNGHGLQQVLGGRPHDVATWSPDGRQLAYTTQQPNGNWSIGILDLTRRVNHPLTPTASSDEQPAWSPDGKRIAFTRQGPNGVWSMYIVGRDGRHLGPLGPRWSASNESPVWSPDGRKIAFVAVTATGASLYVMNADGTRVTPIPTGMSRSFGPAWSPDGRTLAFVGNG